MRAEIKNESFRGLVEKGVTLIELTVVIVVLLVLIGVSMYAISGYHEYKLRMKAETALRAVYTAQRTYLAEHPTMELKNADEKEMKKYMSDGSGEWPEVYGKDGKIKLIYNVKVSPPVFSNDPSEDTKDKKWDLGKG